MCFFGSGAATHTHTHSRGCNHACTVTHVTTMCTTGAPDQNKYMTDQVLIHEVGSIEVYQWQAGNINCSPLFLTTESDLARSVQLVNSVTSEVYDSP